jgi:hypothetical protein
MGTLWMTSTGGFVVSVQYLDMQGTAFFIIKKMKREPWTSLTPCIAGSKAGAEENKTVSHGDEIPNASGLADKISTPDPNPLRWRPQ